MRSIVAALLLLGFCASPALAGEAWNERHPTDKILHFVWGGATQTGLSMLIGRLAPPLPGPEIGLAGAVVTGVAKELVDQHFDGWDAAATIGGGVVSYAVDKLFFGCGAESTPAVAITPVNGGGLHLAFSGQF